FYDDGGASANYSNNFEGSVTFQPKDESHKIQLSFTAFETYYSHKLLIYNGSNDTAPLIDEYSNSTLPNDIKSTSADGCLTIKFSSGSYSSKAGWEAEVSNYQPQPMSFVSADGFQNNISALAPGDIEQEIVGFTVKTKGLLTPLSAQSVTFDISATTNNADITKAYLYFSNTNTFNTSSCEKVAEISSITGNQITFNLSKPLTEGDSYFWLAVDVDQNAAQNNIIDASISKVVISGSDYSVATNNPDGSRVVKRIYNMEKYKEITTSGGMFYDDGGAESDYSNSFEGVVIFKPTNANNKMRISFNYFDTESNSGCTYDYMIIYDGVDPKAPELGRFCGTDTPPEFISTSTDGNLCIYFHSDSGTGKAGWEATIEEYTPAPMTFASSNTIEYSNADVCKGMVAEPIIGLKVVTNGSLNPLLATNISVDLLGTQDVSKINVYYTGKSAVFSRDNLVGEQLVSTTNNNVAINKELGSGDNYFWVTYDISPNATVGAFAKAEVSNITVGGLVYQNSKANLSGRLIQSYVNMPSTKDNTIVVGDDISFYDDGGKDGLHAKDIIGSITFVPADATKKIKVEFTDFELQNYGVDFDVFNGLTNNGLNKITELKGDQVPAPVKSTSDEGALHFYFKSSPMFTQKAGWISRVYCYDPKPLELERSQATQRERSFLQRNTQDQLILGVELTTSGEKEVVDFTKMTFSTQGCTKASDISSAKLYYTNQLNKFQTGELLAEVKNPSGEFSFEFNKQVKYEDTYYYWLCFDIANDAVPNDIIDAVLVSVTANGNVVNATEGNPLGKRVIRKALSGTYTIDANPNVDADFVSITEATQALNILGVSDAVTFNIASGEYQGALLLNEISGASNDNTIVFTSATNNSNDVTIKWNGTEEANTVLTMNGADFVTFQHLSFINKGSRYSRLLDLYGEANNNKFINNVFEGVELNVSDNEDDKILVYYGGSDHKSLDNNNHFIGNTFKYGKMAMSYQGINAISDFEEGTVIKNNTFFNQYFKSVYLNYQDNIIIEGNTFIQNNCKREFQAIDFFQNHKNATIVKNTFNLDCGSKGGSAIFLRNFNSVDQSHSLVANNFVYMTSTSRQIVGIELQDVDYLDIYHNTIKIDGSSTSSKAMFFDKRGSSVFDNLKIKNNIFSVYSGGFVIWSKAQATNSVFANNNYFVNSDATNFAKYGDLVAANITDWQAAIDDENSINIDPEFVSATDLHISGTNLKFGVQLPEVSDDIDGDIRNAATPYIGADEIPDATFEGGYPKFTNVSAVSANMVLKIAEAGTVYFVVMPKGSNLPSVQQIKEGQNADGQNALFSGNVALAVGDKKSTLIDGLTEKTSYDVVLVVEKQNGEYSSVIKLLLSTLDVTAPEFVENTPLLKEVTDNSFMVEAKINESGFVYYALYAGNINNVSVDDVKNGNSAILAGKINADKESFIRCNDLSAGTKYNLFVIAEDNQENANIQNMPIMVSVKTLFGISVSNFTANSVEGSKVVLNWLQPENPANVIIVSSEDNNFGSPQSGTEYNVGDVFNNGGKVLYKGKASNFEHTTVEVGKTYYYRIYTYNSEKEYSQYLQNFAVVKNDKWTILVYLDGDNNLEGNAISDINEMESVNLPDDVNVIVQIDRTPGEDFSNGNWADTRRYKITHDNDLSIINSQRLDTENPLGELNMGDQKTLSDFVEWGIKSYPAEKVMLIMWDHGGGWRSETNFNVTKGVCWDDTNGNDYLEMREVTDALASAESKTNKKLNILGFDVCLAGMMEVAYQTKDVVADYSVFSQALVPGSGWNYDGWLTTLANNVDASSLELAQSAVNSYKDEYSGKLNVTMSAFDMSKVDELKESVDNFTTAYLSTTLEASVINGAFNNSDLFTARKNYIDLGLFMNYCANNLSDNNSKAKATDVINKLSQAVVLTGNTGNFINATGLNIYFHKFNDYEWNEYCAPYCNFADKSNWKWFVKNYDKDGLAPMFIDGYPKTVNISNTSLDIVVKTNKTGNAYYVILDADADAPSVSQVKEGKNSTGEAVADNYCGSVATVKYLVSKKSITNLASNSNYDIYFVLDDEAGVTCNDVIKYKTATLNRKVATFENLLLANNSFNNGSDNSGGFNDGGFFFQNYYSSMSWSGFAYSNKTDNTVESLPGQYTAYAGSGAENSSNYGVCYVIGTFSRVDITDAGDGVPVSGFYVTNNNYAYYSMKNGDVVAKKFGGESGNDPDWFKLTVKGVDKQGHYTGDVEFYLADFRSDNNSDDYIVDSWKWVDLTSLGNVDKLEFRLSSSDNGSCGMNTPAYFCLDNLNGNAPVDHAPVVKAAIDNIVVNQNSADRVINLNTVFEDPDGDELTFEVVSNSNQSLIQTAINSGNLTISFANNQAGDGQITLKATANGKSVSTTFGVTVNAVEDHAPVVIKAIDNIIVDMNADAVTFDLTKVFADA
ncbi:MAG: DUF4465 domain-containing protein, partial [Bacteroidales bacterium]|nr:DUF4465 domain-containing protein [Bacteroidales bacterium]